MSHIVKVILKLLGAGTVIFMPLMIQPQNPPPIQTTPTSVTGSTATAIPPATNTGPSTPTAIPPATNTGPEATPPTATPPAASLAQAQGSNEANPFQVVKWEPWTRPVPKPGDPRRYPEFDPRTFDGVHPPMFHNSGILHIPLDKIGLGNRPTDPPSRPTPTPEPPQYTPGTGDRGMWIQQGSTPSTGLQADVSANYSFPLAHSTDTSVDVTVYGPTNMPAGNSCIEFVDAHWVDPNDITVHHGVGFWDWCGPGAGGDGTGGWQQFYTLSDTGFMDKYATTATEPGTYIGEASHSDQVFRFAVTKYSSSPYCWRGYLWNFQTSTWDTKAISCGTNVYPYGPFGWTMFESFHMNVSPYPPCYDVGPFHHIASYSLKVVRNNVWVGFGSSDYYAVYDTNSNHCLVSGAWHYYEKSDHSQWEVETR